ncbi:MFS transporter [Alteraurantiacibacter aestuarii]|uniref:MFS transporter n=1 Tax=Alteraurantiacibacter aestuarii TaxID=650004 RepID=A0A844ZLB2_9SPHN|nr:MFS transporter [Alteraurantiacibacter aestuarii]MXO87647.1 MFS transporter [Alteraurantiacibacter aestuarii]
MSTGTGRKGLVLSENRLLRLFTFFFFYFGQGLPVGLTIVAIPAWVAANGGSSANVATLVGVAYLPWSWKFAVAALMDRYSYLPMGRRRGWLIFAQLLMSGGFVGAAVLAPGPQDIDALIMVTFLVMAGAATQDVAVDGLAVDLLPEEEQGTASSFMFGGQFIGRALAAVSSGIGLVTLGPAITFLLFIPVLLAPTLYAVMIREHPGEKRFPWSEGQASAATLAVQTSKWLGWDGLIWVTLKSLLRGASLWFVISQSLLRVAEGMLIPMWPLLAVTFLAMSTEYYTSMVSTLELICAIIALGLGSALTLKLGARWSVVLVCALNIGLVLVLMTAQPVWAQRPFFIALTACWALLTILSSITTNPLRMQLSDKRASATQFTIYNSIANFPVAIGAWTFAWLGGIEDHVRTLTGAAVIFTLAAISFALLRMPRPSPPPEVQPMPA